MGRLKRPDDPAAWSALLEEARQLQSGLAAQVDRAPDPVDLQFVAGADAGFEKNDTICRAAFAVLRYPDLELVETAVARSPVSFPYIPGYLSFREIPALIAAYRQLTRTPDIILFDGNGIAHPRRFGIASHFGLITNQRAIGVGKSRLLGSHDPVPDRKGAWVPLEHRGSRIGAVVRTRVGVKPVYVSIGHRTDLESAIDIVMRCVTRYRLPETTRHAHRLASG